MTNNWLVVSNMWIIFHVIYGMSSFPLTYSYFSEGLKPPTSDMFIWCLYGVSDTDGYDGYNIDPCPKQRNKPRLYGTPTCFPEGIHSITAGYFDVRPWETSR